MVEVKPIDVLTDRSLAQWFMEDEVYKGMKIAPMLRYAETRARRYDFFTREKTAEEAFSSELTEEPMPSAKGSELTLVRTTEMEADSERMRMFGYRYIVDNDMIEETPENFLADLEDLAYGITVAIESDAAAAIVNNATDENITLENSTWDASTKIDLDLQHFKETYGRKNRKNSTLDTMLYHGTNLTELNDYIAETKGADTLVTDGQDTIYSQIRHCYIANGIAEGSVYGWNSMLPPGTIVYRKLKGAYEPAKVENGYQYRPLINMARIEHNEGLQPTTEFQFGAIYAIPMPRKEYIFMNNI